MANYAFVTTRRKMDPDRITEIIQDFNIKKLHRNLTIDRTENFWQLTYEELPSFSGYRTCTLVSPRRFQMRHNCGSPFMMWVDSFICNEVALEYDGTLSDEGISDRWKGRKGHYSSFKKYYELLLPPSIVRGELWDTLRKLNNFVIPKSFQEKE